MEGGSIKGEKKEERVKVGKEQRREKAEREGENGDWKESFTDRGEKMRREETSPLKVKLTQA